MRFPRPSRNVVGWIAAGVLLYAFFLVIYLPASIVTSVLPKATQNRVNIANTTGSIWRGQGVLVISTPGAVPTSLGTIAWDLRLPYLFLARLRIDMQLSDGPVSANASVVRTIRSLQLRSLHAQFPASQLATVYPLLSVANLRGDVALDASWIRLSRFGLHGDAALAWRGAGSENFGLDNLGDFLLRVTGDMAPLRAILSTSKGDVILNGEGTWETASSGQLKLGVTIEPRGRQPALGPLLQSWAKPAGEGRYRYELDTNIPVPRTF